jgi:hypothetical protein
MQVPPLSGEPQQDLDPCQQQQVPHTWSPLQKTVAAVCSSPTHSRSTAASAAAPSGPPYHVQRPPVGVVTLGSMSGPVMGSFPVRKLLHSGSASASHGSHAAQHSHQREPARGSKGGICSISLHRVHSQHRRPESAAAASGSRASLGSGIGSLALRPGSAAVLVGAGSQHSSIMLQHSTGISHQQSGGDTRPKQQQQQHTSKRQQLSGVVPVVHRADDGVSTRGWGSPDGGRAAQLMLESFLQGQH